MPCASWCSPPYTCDNTQCSSCDACHIEPPTGGECKPWCIAAYNCGPGDASNCGGCEACAASPDSASPTKLNAASQCEPWCAAPYTCAQSECAGCAACAPNPPPPPLQPTKFGRTNPFMTQGGWYVHPQNRQNILDTLTRAKDASSTERKALEAMARAPSAFWIDTNDKVRGKNRPTTLEGVLENASATAAAK